MSNSDGRMIHQSQQTGTTSLVIECAFHVTFMVNLEVILQKRLTTIFDMVVNKQERRYI